MQKIQTHYQILNVDRDATDETIRSSYLALAKQFHPDINPSEDALKIMKVINHSYDVLSDTEKRRLHDLWIEKSENELSPPKLKVFVQPQNTVKKREPVFSAMVDGDEPVFFNHHTVLAFGAAIISICFVFVALRSSAPAPLKPVVVKSPTAITEQPVKQWPATSSYLDGYSQENNQGQSTILIDNLQSESDYYVKLVDVTGASSKVVRHAFVKGGSLFTLENLTAGQYKIIYRDVRSGELTKSAVFSIEEMKKDDGVDYSVITFALRESKKVTWP